MNRPACPFLRSAPTENSPEARPETGKNHYLASAPPYPGPQETYLYMDPYTLFEDMLAADTARLAAADSTLTAQLQAAAETHQTKFWLVDNFWNWLVAHGVGPGWSDGITFLCLCLALAFTVWAVDRIISRFVIGFIKQRVLNSKTDIDDILFRRKFFGRLLYLAPLGIVLFGITIFFRGFDPSLILAARLITRSAIIFTLLLVCFSLLDTLNDLYQRRPEAQRRSIKGYIQICKIFLTFLAVILIIATLLQKNPTTLLVGLGAAAAVLSLVFKDTLLGLVASIQLSAQDMVRPGDWIEMPSKGADGTVLDINLNSVKVRNWDNTITMIPIYSMVSEAFINWRGMESTLRRPGAAATDRRPPGHRTAGRSEPRTGTRQQPRQPDQPGPLPGPHRDLSFPPPASEPRPAHLRPLHARHHRARHRARSLRLLEREKPLRF